METPETCPQTWDEKRLQKALDYVPPVQYGCSDRAHGGMQVTAGDVWDVLNDMVRHREVFTEAIARLTAELASVKVERDCLQQYRDKMEDAHGSKLYAIEKLLDHFTEDGELKGDGKWRIREIWQCCKDIEEGSERAAKLFNGEASTERDELREKLAAIEAAAELPDHEDANTGIEYIKPETILKILHPTP